MPFPEYTDQNVIVTIYEGKRPSRPRKFDVPGMTRAVWNVAQACWHKRADERPEANAVLQSLEALADSGVCNYKGTFVSAARKLTLEYHRKRECTDVASTTLETIVFFYWLRRG